MPDWKIVGESLHPKGNNPFGNRFYGYRSTELVLPDGNKANYYGIVVADCVHVVAVEDDLTTYLVRQSRPNARGMGSQSIPITLELPGGFQKPGVSKSEAANSELQEEIKKTASSLEHIGTLLAYPGISNETDTIFLARGLMDIHEESMVESTEQDIQIVAEPFGKLYDRILKGNQPVTAQTLAGLALASSRL